VASITATNGRENRFTDIVLSDMSAEDISRIIPPGTQVTMGDNDTPIPFGTTVGNFGVYLNPKTNLIRVTDINGVKGITDDWLFSKVSVMK